MKQRSLNAMATILAFLCLPALALAQPLTATDITAILSAHNEARYAVTPPAAAMPALVWDKNLAAVAQAYASLGHFGHNSRRTSQYRARRGSASYVGENIAAISGFESSVSTLVGLWVAEGRWYNAATNRCPGHECGHYTQVVWANTVAIGCGRAAITSPFVGTMLVCNYAPGGNYAGQAPYVVVPGSN